MPEPVSIITLCCIGIMCLVSLGRTLKDELREAHEKRFDSYTRRPFSPQSTDPATLKLYAHLFALLKKHAKHTLVKRQTPVGAELVVGDTARFARPHARCLEHGMWIYLDPTTLNIVLLCYDAETRDAHVERLEREHDDDECYELTEVWTR